MGATWFGKRWLSRGAYCHLAKKWCRTELCLNYFKRVRGASSAGAGSIGTALIC